MVENPGIVHFSYYTDPELLTKPSESELPGNPEVTIGPF